MLALLPQILFLGAFAATLIRLTVSLMLVYNAWELLTRQNLVARIMAVVQIALSAALFVGGWTQAVALLACIMLVALLFRPRFSTWPRSTILMLLVMTLTLVVTGPGALAFDLPL